VKVTSDSGSTDCSFLPPPILGRLTVPFAPSACRQAGRGAPAFDGHVGVEPAGDGAHLQREAPRIGARLDAERHEAVELGAAVGGDRAVAESRRQLAQLEPALLQRGVELDVLVAARIVGQRQLAVAQADRACERRMRARA